MKSLGCDSLSLFGTKAEPTKRNDMTTEIDLTKFANADIRLARREGEIAICQTKRGTLTLGFDGTTYRLGGAEIKAGQIQTWEITGKPAVIRAALVDLYVVVTE